MVDNTIIGLKTTFQKERFSLHFHLNFFVFGYNYIGVIPFNYTRDKLLTGNKLAASRETLKLAEFGRLAFVTNKEYSFRFHKLFKKSFD